MVPQPLVYSAMRAGRWFSTRDLTVKSCTRLGGFARCQAGSWSGTPLTSDASSNVLAQALAEADRRRHPASSRSFCCEPELLQRRLDVQSAGSSGQARPGRVRRDEPTAGVPVSVNRAARQVRSKLLEAVERAVARANRRGRSGRLRATLGCLIRPGSRIEERLEAVEYMSCRATGGDSNAMRIAVAVERFQRDHGEQLPGDASTLSSRLSAFRAGRSVYREGHCASSRTPDGYVATASGSNRH